MTTGTGEREARRGKRQPSSRAAVAASRARPDAPCDVVLPFPRALAGTGPAADGAEDGPAHTLADAVAELAARGLTPEEIAARLDCPVLAAETAPPWVEAAMERGRALGRAHLKEALYAAALGGGVTAQRQALALLHVGQSEPPENPAEAVAVERCVLPAGDPAPGGPRPTTD